MKAMHSISHWTEAVALLTTQGQAYVLVTLIGARGSTPRESGTKMVVAAGTNYGTIGGGHLEFKAMEVAAGMLATGTEDQRIENFPLGPGLGQCCGGSLKVLFESFPPTNFDIALFGAGHVGLALAGILQHLPCRLRWVDSREGQVPPGLPANVISVTSDPPAAEVNELPPGSFYLIMTHNHQLDFDILEAVLKRGDACYIGLIGSNTKWRRFQLRLEHRGYASDSYREVHCPVGLQHVPGKRPVEIAVSIAAQVIAVHHGQSGTTVKQQGVDSRDDKREARATQLQQSQLKAL